MKKEYEFPVTAVTVISEKLFLMANMSDANDPGDYPGNFAPERHKPF